MVELGEVDQAARADSIQQTKGTNTIGLGSVLRHLERHSDVGHGSKIVDLMRLDFTHDVEKVGRVAKITIVKEKLQSSLRTNRCTHRQYCERGEFIKKLSSEIISHNT